MLTLTAMRGDCRIDISVTLSGSAWQSAICSAAFSPRSCGSHVPPKTGPEQRLPGSQGLCQNRDMDVSKVVQRANPFILSPPL